MKKRRLRGRLIPRDDSCAELAAALAEAWEDGVAAAGKVLDLEAGKAALLAVCGQQPDAGTAGSGPPVLHGRAPAGCRQRPRRWLRAQALAAAGARAAVAFARSGDEQRGPGRRRVVMTAAAAVVLVAGGTWYGLTAGLGGAGRPAGTVNQLTAVKGCPGLAATSGTLERVTGTRLVLKTPGGEPVTVTTAAGSTISRQVAGTVSEISDGAYVIVFGAGSRGGIAAQRIMIGTLPEPSSGPAPARDRQGHALGHPRQRRAAGPGDGAEGKVTDASTGSFTVVMPGGSHVRVTTSGSTTVYAQAAAALGQLQAGGFVVAVGSAKAGGRWRRPRSSKEPACRTSSTATASSGGPGLAARPQRSQQRRCWPLAEPMPRRGEARKPVTCSGRRRLPALTPAWQPHPCLGQQPQRPRRSTCRRPDHPRARACAARARSGIRR